MRGRPVCGDRVASRSMIRLMSGLRFRWRSFLQGGLLALAGGGFLLYAAVGTIVDSFRQPAWIATDGKVVEARVVRTRSGEKTVLSYRFRYSYRVDGVEYTSRRYSLASGSGDPATALELYHEGDVITVFYDPDERSSALVKQGSAGPFIYLQGGLGVFLGLLGLGLTLADVYEFFFHPNEVIVRFQEEKLRRAASMMDRADPSTAETLAARIGGRLRAAILVELLRDRKYSVIAQLSKSTDIDLDLASAVVERIADQERDAGSQLSTLR